jgi:thioredoxin-like negative regulator of GroEL
VKLGIKVLPAVLMFADGVAVDRTVGFADFGARDDFCAAVVERRLARSGVLVAPRRGRADDSEDEGEAEQVRGPG